MKRFLGFLSSTSAGLTSKSASGKLKRTVRTRETHCMLRVFGSSARDCDGSTRRSFLQAGMLGVGGMGWEARASVLRDRLEPTIENHVSPFDRIPADSQR